jgi:hypothetical protein
MNTPLKGRTFCYRHHGKEIIRQVLDLIPCKGEPLYLLLDPVNNKRCQAHVTVFNQMFQTTSGEIKAPHFKGDKIGGAKQLQNL